MLAKAGDLNLPATVTAGTGLSIPTSGSGEATLYLVGPGTAIKRKVQLGQDVQLSADELQNAGRYVIAIDGNSAAFFVTAAPVHSIAFLARPSRVPSNTPNVISGTAFLFDHYQNLVLQPQPVKFELSVEWPNGQPHRDVEGRRGLHQARFVEERRPGAVRRLQRRGFRAPRGAASGVRSLQHSHDARSVTRTAFWCAPIRFATAPAIPFPTAPSSPSPRPMPEGKSTVDARIKRGIAEAQLPASNDAPSRWRPAWSWGMKSSGRWPMKKLRICSWPRWLRCCCSRSAANHCRCLPPLRLRCPSMPSTERRSAPGGRHHREVSGARLRCGMADDG